MQKLLWRFFPPFEVKLTLREAHAFFQDNGALCKDLVLKEVVKLTNDTERVVYSIRIEHQKPDQLALLLITNVVGKQLSSGWHHIYRGVLSMVGADMLSVWTSAVNELEKRGYYTEAEAKEDHQWIRERVAQVG